MAEPFSNRIHSWQRSLSMLAVLLTGAVLGGIVSLLSINAQGQFWTWALVSTGILVVIMVTGYVLIRIIRNYYSAGLASEAKSDQIFGRIAPFLRRTGVVLPNEEDEFKALLSDGAKTASAAWASFVALGHVVALAGGLVAMAQVVAAYRQVERLDTQNELLRFQNEELLASKESDLFIAQLVPLLDFLSSTENDIVDPNAALEEPVEISRDLYARIQTLATSLTPHRTVTMGDHSAFLLTSPERGRLYLALVSVGFNFSAYNLPAPFDFSGAEFPEADLSFRSLGNVTLDNASLLGLNLLGADFSDASLRGALLPSTLALAGANFIGSDLQSAVIPYPGWLDQLKNEPLILPDADDDPSNNEVRHAQLEWNAYSEKYDNELGVWRLTR